MEIGNKMNEASGIETEASPRVLRQTQRDQEAVSAYTVMFALYTFVCMEVCLCTVVCTFAECWAYRQEKCTETSNILPQTADDTRVKLYRDFPGALGDTESQTQDVLSQGDSD